MTMEPEEIRKLVKRVSIIASFFLLALLFYFLGRDGRAVWNSILLLYALLVTVVMVLAILVQSGRGGGLAGLGGAGGGESLLGARAATPIAKATYVLAALLLFICMLLARMGHEAAAAPVPGMEREMPVFPDEQPAPPSGEGQGAVPGGGDAL